MPDHGYVTHLPPPPPPLSAAGYTDDVYEDIPIIPPFPALILDERQMANLNLAVIEGLDK